MDLIFHKRTYLDLLEKKADVRKLFGISEWEERFKYDKHLSVSMEEWDVEFAGRAMKLLEQHQSIYGVRALIYDIQTWLDACAPGATKGPEGRRARSANAMTLLITELIRRSPGHRIYKKRPEGYDCYYVNEIEHHREAHDSRGNRIPPFTRIKLLYQIHGSRQTSSVDVGESESVGATAAEALRSNDLFVETPALREEYLKCDAQFEKLAMTEGKQLLVTATMCGTKSGQNRERHSGREIQLVNTRCVVDEDRDGTKEARDSGYVSSSFWRIPEYAVQLTKALKGNARFELPIEKIEEMLEAEKADQLVGRITLNREEPEIPRHHDFIVFSLKHHLRGSIHVASATEYVYDEQLVKKVVMPPEHMALIDMLVEQEDDFEDIVGGKGAGAVILCEGIPGTGKTLTAEMFAEKRKCALYSVQAAQLGLDAEELETNLAQVFRNAGRWNAIVLIDEADVFVAHRGTDLQQNAIVGTFLRVLEYQRGTVFMTTNRADLVDDAVLSRCIAKVTYTVPTKESDQIRLWRTLAAQNDLRIPDGTLTMIAKEHPGLSGRDVKNLLKLARLTHRATKKPITSQMVAELRKYKPTTDATGMRVGVHKS